jgi:chaperonin GroEL
MKIVLFSDEARLKLQKGINLISNAVKATLGPKGRNVLYGFHYGYPISTKDGVTVARQVECKDQMEQLGLLAVRQAAVKTADDTGDGTTTASLLVQAIYNEGLKSIVTGCNPVMVKKGIDKAVDAVVKFIEKHSIKVEKKDILNVATISANNDRAVGQIVAEALEKVGDDGVITIEDSPDEETSIDIVDGMQLNEGYLSHYFVTPPLEKLICRYENPYILLVDGTIDNPMAIKKIVEDVIVGEKRPLVIICHGMSPVTLQVLVSNRVQSGLPLVACKASQFAQFRTDLLGDMAALTGATVVGSVSGVYFQHLKIEHLGQCEVFKSGKSYTNIAGGKGNPSTIAMRIQQIEAELKGATSDYEKQKLQERYAKLTSGVAVIKVGAQTEVEQKEKKMRVEDALCATRTAIEGGVVVGSGVMLLRASKIAIEVPTQDEKIGVDIVKRAIVAVIEQIAVNAGLEVGDIKAEIVRNENTNYGYDFLNDKYGDLIEMGIIDPTKVVVMALRNGASVAGMLLGTEVLIAEEEEQELTRTPRGKSE